MRHSAKRICVSTPQVTRNSSRTFIGRDTIGAWPCVTALIAVSSPGHQRILIEIDLRYLPFVSENGIFDRKVSSASFLKTQRFRLLASLFSPLCCVGINFRRLTSVGIKNGRLRKVEQIPRPIDAEKTFTRPPTVMIWTQRDVLSLQYHLKSVDLLFDPSIFISECFLENFEWGSGFFL